MAKRSAIWKHYLNCEDSKYAKCNKCNCEISRGGVGKSASTTSLINHLKRKHQEEYKIFLEDETENKKSKKVKQATISDAVLLGVASSDDGQ